MDLQGVIKPNLARVLPYFQNDILKTPDLKIKFIGALSGIDWAEVSGENALEIMGLLSRTLDSLSLDTEDSRIAFISSLKDMAWSEASEDNTSKVTGLLSKILDSLSLDTPQLKVRFIGSLSGLDWRKIPAENISKVERLLSAALKALPWEYLDTPFEFGFGSDITNSIVDIFLDKTGKLNETLPQEVQEIFFKQTKSLNFQKGLKNEFAQILPKFKDNVLATGGRNFVTGLSTIDWNEVTEANADIITELLSTVLASFPWYNPHALEELTKPIVGVFLDKDGKLKEAIPQKIQEVFFQKTRAFRFNRSTSIPNDSAIIKLDEFLKLNQILPQFIHAKDKITHLTIEMSDIDQIPDLTYLETLKSLTFTGYGRVGTVDLRHLPPLNNLKFDCYIDKLIIHPVNHDFNLKSEQYLRVKEIQGIENLDVFQKDTLSSRDPFFKSMRGLEALKFTHTNDKIENLTLESSSSISHLEGLENLLNLRVLDLSRSKVTSMGGFENLTQLRKLNLSGSQFQSLVFTENHKTIEELDLTNSKFEDIQGLEYLTQLKRIRFSGEKLRSFTFFPSNAQLERVEISGTSFESIQGLGHLKRLESLHIKETPNLKSITFEEELPNFGSIYADSSGIEEINGVDRLPSLTHLFLGNTPHLKALTFTENNKNLKYINVSKSGVSALEGIDSLPLLQNVYASNTRNLMSLTFGERNEKLEEIDVSRSEVNSIEGLDELSALKVLNLSDAKSLSSTIHFSEKNSEVQEVNLSNTALKNLSGLRYSRKVKKLDLENLDLESLELSTNLKSTSINLSGSTINTLYAVSDPESNILKISSSLERYKKIKVGKIIFSQSDPHLKALAIVGVGSRGSKVFPSVGSIEGLENFPNLAAVTIDQVALSSLNFDHDLKKVRTLSIQNGQLGELKGLEHLPQLRTVHVPLLGPKIIAVPQDVKISQPSGGNNPKLVRIKRPNIIKQHDEE